MSSSDRSSNPDEEAAAAAAPAAAEPATVTPAAKKKRKAKASASVTRDLIVECLREGLGVVLDMKQVDAACKAIVASSTVQDLVKKLEEQAGGKRRKAGDPDKRKGRLISSYGMFVTLVFHALKEAGISKVQLPDVSGVWQALPEQTRADINTRFDAIKTTFNEAVAAGDAPILIEALAAHAQEARLQPIDYLELFNRYKDSAKAAAAATAAAGGGKPKAKAKPGKKAAAAAAAAAEAPAAAVPAPAAPAPAPPATEEKHKKHKKEKKKDKKNKAEAEAAPTTEKKKHKKRKHDKVKQEESD